MTPEALLLLQRMDERIESIDERTQSIEKALAEKAGGDKVRDRMREVGRWGASLVMGAIGVAAGHFWHPTH